LTDAGVGRLKARYDEYVSKRGDELGLFREVARFAVVERVLYPGSYLHITPSLVFDDVVYVDTDRKATRFFREIDDVRALVRELRGTPQPVTIAHHGIDYAHVPERAASFDLLISLYAGFVSEACGWLLRPGGLLLANDSHGDASLAALDPGFELVGAFTRRDRLRTDELDTYLQPKSGRTTTTDDLRRTGRGVAVTRDAKAYLFRRRPGDRAAPTAPTRDGHVG
jgi:hypothetical protein